MYEDLVQLVEEHVLSQRNGKLPFPPAKPEYIAEAESALGFAIPGLLKSLYLYVGNGGYGPERSYGIIGVKGGHASDVGTVADAYSEVKRGAEWLGFRWQEGLLPFCGWGCNIFSCVDCTDPQGPVYRSEECVARQLGITLEEFVKMWLDGIDLLSLGKIPRKPFLGINPFTKEKTWFR